MFQPVIKWSGSKRSQTDKIISYFPNKINTYYEPFCGGASVLRCLLDNKDKISVNKYICSDINKDLIDLWNLIKNDPGSIIISYKDMWNELNKDNDKSRKRTYFEYIREQFNKDKDPLKFMFIMRTTTNGMPRYNSKGKFNNSFHITRDGITPDKLERIIIEWNKILTDNDVEFICQDYLNIKPNENDFIYLDPPYANTKGMYYGGINQSDLWNFLRNVPCKYILSYNGISGNIDNTYKVPEDIYTEHLYIKSGNSSFKRTIGKSNNSIVYESLYIKK